MKHDISEIYDALKRLHKSNVITLREILQREYSAEWSNGEIDVRSIERKIKRKLEILEEMGLINKQKLNKENIYTIFNKYPVKSNAPKIINELLDIISKDKAIYIKAQKPITNLINEIKSPYHIYKNNEEIKEHDGLISKLETAINDRKYINVTYNNKTTKVSPLKIAEFEGIWYLLLYLCKYKSYLKYRISDIKFVEILKENYELNDNMNINIEKWYSIWHNPNTKPTKVTIWISNKIKKYFYQKNIFNINSNKEKITPSHDGIEYELEITHAFEILPTIMYWQPNITILEQDGEINVKKIYSNILESSQKILV